jgi:hypothetical protein
MFVTFRLVKTAVQFVVCTKGLYYIKITLLERKVRVSSSYQQAIRTRATLAGKISP